MLLSETETGADPNASQLPLERADHNDCVTMCSGARLTASTRGRARGCSSVALPRIGDAAAATAEMLAKPPRAVETGEGGACYNLAREAIRIFGDANERAGDATAATAAKLTTLAHAFETGDGSAGSNSAGSASVIVAVLTSAPHHGTIQRAAETTRTSAQKSLGQHRVVAGMTP